MANIIKQLKDADGNNIYPIAYAQGGVKMDLLWTNPSLGLFAGQSINLDTSNYKLLLVLYLLDSEDNEYAYQFIHCDGLQYEMTNAFRSYFVKRGCIGTASTITWTNDYLINGFGSTNGTVNNYYNVPYQIYGIKMSYIVPTVVNGLQYVEV